MWMWMLLLVIGQCAQRKLLDWDGKYEHNDAAEDGEASRNLPRRWPMLDNNDKQIDENVPKEF